MMKKKRSRWSAHLDYWTSCSSRWPGRCSGLLGTFRCFHIGLQGWAKPVNIRKIKLLFFICCIFIALKCFRLTSFTKNNQIMILLYSLSHYGPFPNFSSLTVSWSSKSLKMVFGHAYVIPRDWISTYLDFFKWTYQTWRCFVRAVWVKSGQVKCNLS